MSTVVEAVIEKEDVPEKTMSIALHIDDDMRRQINNDVGALSMAQEYIIDCAEMAQAASNERTTLAKRIDDLKARRNKFLGPAKEIIKQAEELFDPAIKNLNAAREYLGQGLISWNAKE